PAGRLKQYRLRVGLKRLRDLGQRSCAGFALKFPAVIEFFDEPAQPEIVAINGGARGYGDVFQPHPYVPGWVSPTAARFDALCHRNQLLTEPPSPPIRVERAVLFPPFKSEHSRFPQLR